MRHLRGLDCRLIFLCSLILFLLEHLQRFNLPAAPWLRHGGSAIISFLSVCVSVFCCDIINHQNVCMTDIESAIDNNRVWPTRATHTLAFRKLKGAFEVVPVRIGLNESQDIVLVAEVQMAICVKHG